MDMTGKQMIERHERTARNIHSHECNAYGVMVDWIVDKGFSYCQSFAGGALKPITRDEAIKLLDNRNR